MSTAAVLNDLGIELSTLGWDAEMAAEIDNQAEAKGIDLEWYKECTTRGNPAYFYCEPHVIKYGKVEFIKPDLVLVPGLGNVALRKLWTPNPLENLLQESHSKLSIAGGIVLDANNPFATISFAHEGDPIESLYESERSIVVVGGDCPAFSVHKDVRKYLNEMKEQDINLHRMLQPTYGHGDDVSVIDILENYVGARSVTFLNRSEQHALATNIISSGARIDREDLGDDYGCQED